MNADFWLYRWIDEFELTAENPPILKLLTDQKAIEKLRRYAEEDATSAPPLSPEFDNALAASHDMDLSDDLDCCSNVSRVAQINREFPKVLHYFDRIIVSGPSAGKYSHLLADPSDGTRQRLAHHIDGLLYLRGIGADEVVEFANKIPPAANYRSLAEHFELHGIISGTRRYEDLFIREGEVVHLAPCASNHHWHFTFRHPLMQHDLALTCRGKKKPSIKRMARAVIDAYASPLTSDVISARMMQVPLGTCGEFNASMITQGRSEPLIGEAALNLYLPMLDSLPLRDIIRLRKDEYAHFEKFQLALRAALKARLGENGSDPLKAAREVQVEMIDPAISEIDLRFRSTSSALTGKAGLSVGIGSILTSVGIIDSIPLVIGSGLAVAATTVGAIHSYIDKKKEIQLSDMYFLWLLEKAQVTHRRSE